MKDMMPRETATEMLLTEKRLTNTMRKRCLAARESVAAPTLAKRNPDEAIRRKVASRKMTQLVSWLKRSKARRLVVQRAWARAKAAFNMPAPIRASLCALLEEKAKNLERLADACSDEIKARSRWSRAGTLAR
jgi:hypothetical protein